MSENGIFIRIGATAQELVDEARRAGRSLRGLDADGRVMASSMRGSMNTMAKASVAAGIAFTGVGAAVVLAAGKSAKEIKNLAFVANVSTDEFQKLAFAASSVGVEQDKMADILKDVNDKVGDFLTTGAGGMTDFFDNIAPLVGVTAENFKDLSGKDALQLYVTSLEKANLSQAEMTFHMEAIASDSTSLLPLLKDGGKAYKELARQAEKYAFIMSETDISNLVEMNGAISKAVTKLTGMGNVMSGAIAPFITDITNGFLTTDASAEDLRKTVLDIAGAGVRVVGVFADAGRVFEILAEIGVAFGNSIVDSIHSIDDQFTILTEGTKVAFMLMSMEIEETFADLINSFVSGINSAIEAYNSIPTLDKLNLVAEFEVDNKAYNDAINESKQKIKDARLDIEKNLSLLKDDLSSVHDLMMQPLPSDEMTIWFERIREESEKTRVKTEADLLAHKDLVAKTTKEIIDIEQAGADSKLEIDKLSSSSRLDMASGAFGDLSSLVESENKALFEVGKVAAVAQILTSGYVSAQAAYTGGALATGTPWGGAAFAAASVAATAMQLQGVASTSFGGGGSAPQAPSGAAPQIQQQSTSIDVSLTGNNFNKAGVEDLFEQINSGLDDGMVISGINLV